MLLTRLHVTVASLLFLASCGLAQQFEQPSQCDTAVPDNHRPASLSCDSTPPTVVDGANNSGPSKGAPQACSADSDCTSRPNGRCVMGGTGGFCTYNECTKDADCGDKHVCDCRDEGGSAANVCLPGNCSVDSDCGTCGYCSPSKGPCNFGYTTSYYCHTSKDECLNDSDCQATRASVCAFNETLGYWKCLDTFCAG